DERRQKPRAALGDEAGADIQIAEDEERDARDEEPGLDEDDLDRDDRREAPEQLRASGADEPAPAALGGDAPEREQQQVELTKVHRDEREHGDHGGRDRR